MPAKEFNVKDYVSDLLKDSGITDDQRKVVESALQADAVAARLKDSVLRQADYSRQTQTLAEERAAGKASLEAEQGRYQASYGSLAKWKADQEKVVNDWKAELAGAKEREERLTAAVAKARAQGLDDRDLGLDGQPLRGARREEETPNLKYLTTEQFAEERRALGTALTDFTPGLIDIYDRHSRLFPGQPGPNMAALVQAARTQNRSVEDVWADAHKVPERIQTLQQEALDAKLTAAREEGLKQGRDQAHREFSTGQVVPGTPGGRPITLGPAFQVADVKAQFEQNGDGRPADGVERAIQAYRDKTYAAKQSVA